MPHNLVNLVGLFSLQILLAVATSLPTTASADSSNQGNPTSEDTVHGGTSSSPNSGGANGSIDVSDPDIHEAGVEKHQHTQAGSASGAPYLGKTPPKHVKASCTPNCPQ